jgi:acetylornithine deacetylase
MSGWPVESEALVRPIGHSTYRSDVHPRTGADKLVAVRVENYELFFELPINLVHRNIKFVMGFPERTEGVSLMCDPPKVISTSVDLLRDELFGFCQSFVQIPSLPGEEQKAQAFLAAKLKEENLEVDIFHSKLDEVKDHPAFCDDGISFDERINVVGRWRGSAVAEGNENGSGNVRSLILNGHVDVVPVGNQELWEASPWSGTITDGKLYGRGSCDMKSGIAAGIFAVKALQKVGFSPQKDVLIECVIGEESGGVGTLTSILKGYRADAAIIMEPTRLMICPVQSGALTFRIKVPGHAIHASMRRSGVSAIEKLYQILQAVNELEQRRHRSYHNRFFEDPMGIAPINIGTVRGGEWHSTVPNEVIVEGRYGVFPGESNGAAREIFANAIRWVAASDSWLRDHPPILEWIEGQFESGETDINEPIIELLASSHQEMVGTVPQFQGVPYGSDLRLFANHGNIPAVLYGPGDVANAHTVNEFISLKDVITCSKVLALTIYRTCGGGRL